MKKTTLFNGLLVVLILFSLYSCGQEEEDPVDLKTPCKTNTDCKRNQYCDLENPEKDLNTGTLSYFCRDRVLCLTEADCPVNWRCLIEEGFCITEQEADGVLCKSDDDCTTFPNTKCNLATGECYDPNAGGDTGNTGGDTGNTGGDTGGDTGNTGGDTGNTGGDTGNTGGDTGDTSNTGADTGNTGNTGGDTGGDTGNTGSILVSEDFEDGGTNWTATGVWQIGTPTTGPAAAVSGSNVAATNLAGNYTDNALDLLTLNTQINIPSTGSPVVEFMAWVSIEGNGYSPFDFVQVLVKRDTDTWQSLSGLYLTASTPSALDALDNTQTKITKPLGTDYYKFTGDLVPYKGKTVQIGFRFTSDSADNLEGIYIDDVVVK